MYTYKDIQQAIDDGEEPIVAFDNFDKTDPTSGAFLFPTKIHVPYNKSKPPPSITVTSLTDPLVRKVEKLTEEVSNLELTVACNHDHGSVLTQHDCATPEQSTCVLRR